MYVLFTTHTHTLSLSLSLSLSSYCVFSACFYSSLFLVLTGSPTHPTYGQGYGRPDVGGAYQQTDVIERDSPPSSYQPPSTSASQQSNARNQFANKHPGTVCEAMYMYESMYVRMYESVDSEVLW